MFREFRGPETESIVMLARQDQTFHSRSGCGAYNLFRIEVSGVEERRGFIAVSPFPVGESVDSEVKKPIELHRMPAELSGCRGWTIWLRWSKFSGRR